MTWLPILAAILAPTLALAQTDQTGVIEGQVLDPAGQASAGASVTCAQADGSYPHAAVSDPSGRFRIGFLPPGRYDVQVLLPGYYGQKLSGVRVSAAQTASVRIRLEKAPEIREEIRVVAATPLIDTATAEPTIAVVDAERIETLPMARSVTALIDLVPGATQNSVWGGATAQSNAYLFDGVTVNQPGFGGDFLIPNPDWVEELQVRGLGGGAECGDFQGGVINVVTKSGTNTYTGNVRLNYETEALNSSNLVAGEAGQETDSRWEVNADVGGPLIRDKLYYYVSVEQAELKTRVVDTTQPSLAYLPTLEARTEQKLLGKLTWQATGKDRLSLSLGYDNVQGEYRGLDSFTEPAATSEQDSPAYFWSGSWQRVIDPGNFLEVKFTGYAGDDDRFPYRGADLPQVQLLQGEQEQFRNAAYTRLRSPESSGLAVNWESYWNTGSIAHRLKVGGDTTRGDWREGRIRNANLTWRPDRELGPDFDAADPATWDFISSDWGGDIDLDARMTTLSLFVQDYLSLTPRLTVSAGLRFGSWKGEIQPGFGGLDEYGEPVEGVPSGRFEAVSDSAVDPRLGLTFDFSGEGTTVAKLHWGRYHQSLFALMFDRVEGSNSFRDSLYYDWIAEDGDGNPVYPDPDRPYTISERDDPSLFEFYGSEPYGDEGRVESYRQPYVDQIVVGLEKRFTDTWKAGITYVNRRNEDLLALEDRNRAANYTLYESVAVEEYVGDDEFGDPIYEPLLDHAGQPIVLPGLYVSNDDIQYEYFENGEIAPGFTSDEIEAQAAFDQDLVLTAPAGAKRATNQVLLDIERTGAAWRLRGSLVWTDIKGNYESVSGYEDSEGGAGQGPFVQPNQRINWDGRLPGFAEWTAKIDASGQLPWWGLRAGAFLTWNSGGFYTPYHVVNRSADFRYTAPEGEITRGLLFGVADQPIFLKRRGVEKYDSLTELDLHIDKPLSIGQRMSLTLALDIFNALDSAESTSIRIEEPDLGTVYSRQQGRAFRLNALFHW
jgi:hypothetical protein